MKRSDVPVKHALPFALNGSRNAIPETGTAAGAASLTKGFPDETMTPIIAGGTPPDGKDMNGVLYELSAMGRWANAGAEYSYDEAFSTSIGGYPRGARLLGSDGVTVFVSMSDDNTADPEAISASWEGYNPGRSTIALTAGIRILTALEAASSIIALTGTLTGNVQLVFPVWVREWEVINLTSGAFTVTCRTSSGGVVADKGFVTRLYGDGAVLNTWSEVDVEGMVKTVNDNGPDEHGNVKLGTAANADVTTSATDTTAGRVLKVGDYGLGVANGTVSLASIYDITCSGLYAALGSGTDTPTTGVPADSGNTKFAVYAGNIYGNQYLVTLTSNIYFYVGLVNTASKTSTWSRFYNTLNKPTAGDVGALPVSGGEVQGPVTVKRNNAAITIKNASPNLSLYMLGVDEDGGNLFYVGRGGAGYAVALYNYKGSNGINLNEDGSVSITAPTGKNVTTNRQFVPTDYSNFDSRYQAKGNYTPAGEAYTKAQSDLRYVQGIRLSATQVRNFSSNRSSDDGALASSITMVGGSSNTGALYVRYVQQNINGTFVNVAVLN